MRILLTSLFVLLLAMPLLAQDNVPTNPTCPVMVGEAVDPEMAQRLAPALGAVLGSA